MARDPNEIPDTESDIAQDDDTVIDPDLEPYDETVETPLEDAENFIPSEEL